MPPTDSECPFVDFTCEPGLPTSSETFSQSDVCEPLFDRSVTEAGTLIFSGERAVGFKCQLLLNNNLIWDREHYLQYTVQSISTV